MKKLYRSKTDKVIAGICAGLGEYVNVDPTIVRILFVVLLVCTGFFPFGIAYIIGIFVIPEKPDGNVVSEQ